MAAQTSETQTSDDCNQPGRGIGVSRTIQIDTSTGALFGSVTRQVREASFLKHKEVVLTFDDGPMPWVTRSILDTLDAYCTKATFFSVGRMALAYPATVRDILARGHTLGAHTYSHPLNVPRLPAETARAEIERGFAAVATAAGKPIAPFFRFPGLADSASLLDFLQSRRIATFSVDAVSNDSFITEPQKLVSRTVAEVEANGGGIILFHDIKTTTAKALPQILQTLMVRGYTIAHLTPAAPAAPLPELMAEFAPRVAKTLTVAGKDKVLLPFYGALGPEKENTLVGLAVTPINPVARNRLAASEPSQTRSKHADWTPIVYNRTVSVRKQVPAIAPATTSAVVDEPQEMVTGPPVIHNTDAGTSAAEGWTTHIDSAPKAARTVQAK